MRRRTAGILAAAARALVLALVLVSFGPGFAAAETAQPRSNRDLAVFARVFPDAESFGALSGDPPSAPAYRDGAIVGYVFFTRDVVASTGFSAKPLDVAVGIDLAGRITGAEIVEQHEPILVIGVTEKDLSDFVHRYRGLDLREVVRVGDVAGPGRRIDGVSGATVSSLVISDAIMRSARAVARARGILGGAAAAIDLDSFTPADWAALVSEGAVARLHLTNGAVDQALRARGAPGFGPPGVKRDPEASFIDLYVALATPAAIGRNLLGRRVHDRLMAGLAPGDQLLFVAASGLYSFKGTAWRKSGVFDRVALVQGDRTIRLRADWHRRIERVAAEGAPEFREAAVFVVPQAAAFDPTAPWRFDLLVGAEAGERPVFATFMLPYRLPARLIRAPAAAARPEPIWLGVWRAHVGRIAILLVALAILTLFLVLEDPIVRRSKLYHLLRYGFLAFTVAWIGWYAGAQLSVVNVVTFYQALVGGFRWETFLIAPLIFILWSYVAVALLFWGRGVFCGWLCPFGALQELVNRGGRRLGIPQIRLPFVVHERLWMIKYVVFLGLFALSLGGYDRVQPVVEIEPFKTAIVLRFAREWPFVAYALALLAVGLFVERAFCRYLCPLGAALAIPARLRMFDWLKRRFQCGVQCQICASRCTVQAIHPDGRINPNECIHCMNCQMLYHDARTCPPLIARRKRREAARAGAAKTGAVKSGVLKRVAAEAGEEGADG